MIKNNKSTVVCILGMHRSGTSAVTRVLNLMGVYLGNSDDFIAPKPDNPSGFWEHEGIIGNNIQILKYFNSFSYRGLYYLPDDWWNFSGIEKQRAKLKKIVTDQFSNAPLWGWKDPRTCLLLRLWHEILDDLNINVRFVIVVRNPIDVASSLKKRDKISLSRALQLWQLYNLSALRNTSNYNRIVIFYENLLNDTQNQLFKLADFMDVPIDDISGLMNKIDEFLDNNLHHYRSGKKNSDLYSDKNYQLIFELYNLLIDADGNQELLKTDEFKHKVNKLYSHFMTNTLNFQNSTLKNQFLSILKTILGK